MQDAHGSTPPDFGCRQIADLLDDYLEGTLPRATLDLIEFHIEGCAPCVAFVNTYRGTVKAAHRLGEGQIPPELKARLLAVLRTRPASGEARA